MVWCCNPLEPFSDEAAENEIGQPTKQRLEDKPTMSETSLSNGGRELPVSSSEQIVSGKLQRRRFTSMSLPL